VEVAQRFLEKRLEPGQASRTQAGHPAHGEEVFPGAKPLVPELGLSPETHAREVDESALQHNK
jgi:hypothetical protein